MSAFIQELVEGRKAIFVGGATVITRRGIDDPYSPIKEGTKGKVMHVDDIGTVHIFWENGLCLGAGLEDNVEIYV